MTGPSLCPACVRWDGTGACTSFPDGIPARILVYGGDHRESIAGEPPFELAPDRREAYDEWLRYANPDSQG